MLDRLVIAPFGNEGRCRVGDMEIFLSALIPAYDRACHDGQSSSARESSYRLADDWDDVEAP
jgi:hypothetical protein